MSFQDEPRIDPLGGAAYGFDSRSSVKFTRNSKGDTQVEVKVVDGSTEDEMDQLRDIAFQTYKKSVEAAGMRLPDPYVS